MVFQNLLAETIAIAPTARCGTRHRRTRCQERADLAAPGRCPRS
jgi:hypothetical protein